ncbi:MAG: aminopeptidase P family protein [Bacilli bacterium]|jgi:Xaa-Pro aminopeptidase|nr:aminopeptidase P family protein [Bacilli bacterium]
MKINEIMNNMKVDAIYVTSIINIRFLTKFSGSEAKLICLKNKMILLVDSRYYTQAKKQCHECDVQLIEPKNLFTKIAELIKEYYIKNLGIEEDNMVVQDYFILNNFMNNNSINTKLLPLSLNKIRMIKSDEEIATIKKACHITDKAYEHIYKFIKPGISEKEVVNEMYRYCLDFGVDGLAFNIIVASGVRSSMPHGVATDKLIEENDFVTIDFGIIYQGYCSDYTRTFSIGNNPPKKLVEIYHIVQEAQKLAIKNIKPGAKCNEIDKIARDYIEKFGYQDYFKHGLGHSFGLEIHEAPYLNPTDETVLQPGMIITIEPGIYLPNIGGVRIENDILVTENGYENLTNLSTDLLKINN